nr:FecR domain-containing protein [uncultured Dyadobacter sp.]
MNITPELLKRYTAGQCTPAEVTAVEQWLDDPDAAMNGLAEIPGEVGRESGVRVWERLKARAPRSFWVRYQHYLSGAAAILVLVSAIGWYAKKNETGSASRQRAVVQVIRTQKGETRQVTLPDSSVAMLSFDSEIRFLSAFSDSVRRVMLIGEAQFSVKKNPEQPFIVETAATQTRVLGTVFDVREYPGEGHTTLLVTEGKVHFINKKTAQSQILTPGIAGVIAGSQLSTHTVSGSEAQVSWLSNALRFSDAPLTQVVRELERRYNVSIHIDSEALKSQRYTGAFKNPSLHAVLGSLSIAVGLRYEAQGESIRLYE